MAIASAPDLIAAIRQESLLEPEQLEELSRQPIRAADPKELARELVRREWLTPYQVNQVLKGRGQDLILGQYVLMEPLGQGGMGQVFKARQRRLKRIVALKVIRKDYLAKPNAVVRFLREAEVAARLAHANIVTVFDVGETNGVHFLSMEYIDGVTLAKLAKESGSLPPATACDYIRQAAIGLQHAHEQGLVHRDLKPHNLMLTKQGCIKILDLGLARFDQSSSTEVNNEGLTASGTVLGTPEYLAPEQAINARTVDIRADIYSLGCTLYHLLSGRTPFQGESLTETLLKHQLEEAPAIERLRSRLPSGLPEVVRKLMSKRPEDRYQTPIEAAAALEAFCQGGTTQTKHRTALPGSKRSALPTGRALAGALRAVPLPSLSRLRGRWLWCSAIVGVVLLGLGGLVLHRLTRPAGAPPVPVEDPGPRVKRPDTEPPPEKDVPPDLSKLKLLAQHEFDNTDSGFPVRKTDTSVSGFGKGIYFIRVTRGLYGWNNGKQYSNFACRLTGRVTGSPTGGWGLCLACPTDSNRGVCLAISGDGTFQVMASPFAPEPLAKANPQIAPFKHDAIKRGEQFNELLAVVRGRQVNVYLNSVPACEPIKLDRELTSAFTVLMAFAGDKETQAEFKKITICSVDGLPARQ